MLRLGPTVGGAVLWLALASATPNAGRAADAPTFNKDIAPILLEKCANCHRQGQAAPMSLLTYDEVRPWAQSIKSKVLAREMPPWRADPRFGHFRNDPSLTTGEIETIVAWVDAGASQGSIRCPPRRRWWPAGITRPADRPTS